MGSDGEDLVVVGEDGNVWEQKQFRSKITNLYKLYTKQ